MCLVSYITCRLCVIHNNKAEFDYPETIIRLLGKKWAFSFNFMSMLIIYFVGIIHFILMANTVWSIILNIAPAETYFPRSDEITFKYFSMQYLGIILYFICGLLYNIRDLSKLLAVNDKGVYMIICFSLFLLYLGVYSLFNADITFANTGIPGKNKEGLEIILYSADLSELIGVFALAYYIHGVVIGIMKSNKVQSNNSRDLFWAYLLVFSQYTILGVFGCFAVAALYHNLYDPLHPPSTILDLIHNKNPFLSTAQKIIGIFSMAMIFTQLITVLPLLAFFCRRQFFNLFFESDYKVTNTQFHLFNFFFNTSCLIFEILVFPPSKVIGFTGALGGFLLVYIIPIISHFICLKKSSKSENKEITDDMKATTKEEKFIENEASNNFSTERRLFSMTFSVNIEQIL